MRDRAGPGVESFFSLMMLSYRKGWIWYNEDGGSGGCGFSSEGMKKDGGKGDGRDQHKDDLRVRMDMVGCMHFE